MGSGKKGGYRWIFLFIVFICLVMALVNNCSSRDQIEPTKPIGNEITGHDWIIMSENEKFNVLSSYLLLIDEKTDIDLKLKDQLIDNHFYIKEMDDFFTGTSSNPERLNITIKDAIELIVSWESAKESTN
ncbi:hypothetical protein P9G84_10070 [Brevibacillus centrosporus]|uniref:hypothetical protein n=1 Tax=Brevibacillus centrosporus TaxID=54910 RepID=UPI0011448EA1|nr:hypothetical protein [Brevibacillus centrosporus]MEC2129313.1 hypothetical protein [Brevibacillus centrosporus]GED33479.1 hypothetical protein BCE02nite_46200 [Brevibacillus centrosporus]